MQVEVDVKACAPSLVGVASWFGDFTPFYLPSKRPSFPFGPWIIVHEGQKIP